MRILEQMKPKKGSMTTADEENNRHRKEKRLKTFRIVKLFCLLCGLLVFYRICYDISVYCRGGTIAVRMTGTYDYLIRFPPGYTVFSAPRPLLVFLHGAGDVGLDVKKIANVDPFHYASGKVPQKDFPFIEISPVVPSNHYGWNAHAVKQMIDDFLQHHGRLKIDPKRIYLTGFSMGGFGTFNVAEKFPDFFAAVAPLAGGGNPDHADQLKSLPILAFHGDADEGVPYQCSVKMIEAIKAKENDEARLVTIPEGGHQICPVVYGNSEIYHWFLEHEKW